MTTLLATAAPERASDALAPLEHLSPAQVIAIRGEVFHVQGLDLDGGFIYVTSVDKKSHRGFLHKFTRDGALVGQVDLTDGSRYHTGGLSLVGDTIWLPVAEYRPHGTSRIVAVDKTSLKPVSSFLVSDHIGAVGVDGERVYGANWDAERFYVWNRAGRAIASHATRTHVAYQEIKFTSEGMIASGIVRGSHLGAIDWLDPETLAPVKRLAVGDGPDGLLFTREGMALDGGKLYLLPDDGHDGGAQIYAFDFLPLRTAASACPAALTRTCPRGPTVAALH